MCVCVCVVHKHIDTAESAANPGERVHHIRLISHVKFTRVQLAATAAAAAVVLAATFGLRRAYAVFAKM